MGVFPHGLAKTIFSILKIAPLMMQQSFAKLMRRQLSGPSIQFTARLPIAAARHGAKLDAFG
jgi:hypothetical protein